MVNIHWYTGVSFHQDGSVRWYDEAQLNNCASGSETLAALGYLETLADREEAKVAAALEAMNVQDDLTEESV